MVLFIIFCDNAISFCVFFVVQVFFSLWCISVVWFTTWVVFKRDVHNWFRLPCRLSQAQFVHVWAQDQLEILSINVTMVVHFVRKVKVLLSSLDQIFSKTPFALLLDSPFQHHPLALFWTSPPLTVWEVYGYSCCTHSSRPVSFFCTIQPAPQKLKGEVRGFTSWEIRKLQGISTSGGIRELQEASQSWGIRNFDKQLRERRRSWSAATVLMGFSDTEICCFGVLFCAGEADSSLSTRIYWDHQGCNHKVREAPFSVSRTALSHRGGLATSCSFPSRRHICWVPPGKTDSNQTLRGFSFPNS